ncbi:hypothetical protein M8J75_007947 [Diaphorina citri]|nr:hypothetical protein M8J75_007947 [Diaphorina citri]
MCMKLEINMEKRLRASQDKTMKKIIEVDKKFTPLNLTTETTPENVMGKEQLKEQELNEEGKGYQVDKDKNPINHLFYVDDLKLFTTNNKDMDKLLTTVKTFSEDVKMKLGLEKCARVTTEKGKIKRKDHTQIKDDNTAIKELNGSELYKYLGMEESEEVDHKAMKTKIMQQYYKRVRKILQSQLTGRNKFTAITTIAVPVLTYSFGILTWTMAEIQAIDRKTRKLLTLNNLHNPNADVDRLYIPRVRGGRGLTNIEQTYKLSIIGLGEYIERKEDTLMTQLREYEKTRDSDRTILKRKEEYKRQCITESENNHREINEKPMLEEIRKIKTKWKKDQSFTDAIQRTVLLSTAHIIRKSI